MPSIAVSGPHDRSLSIDGSQFNLNRTFHGATFDDLASKLSMDGKMGVIRYDKRNCNDCGSIWPPFCPSDSAHSCFLEKDCCYNDTNMTVRDVLFDAHRALTTGTAFIASVVDPDIVAVDRLWPIPIGFSAQGASIAVMLASDAMATTTSTQKWYGLTPTAVSLMGSGVPIGQLLAMQLRARLSAVNGSDALAVEEAVDALQRTLQCIENGTFALNDTVNVSNSFLSAADFKVAQYWRDWMALDEDIDFVSISNFMSINSHEDMVIDSAAFSPIEGRFAAGNGTVEHHVFHDLNHFMVDTAEWSAGRWTVDEKVPRHIIEFVDDISGYLDDIDRYIALNATAATLPGTHEGVGVVAECATVNKVCLYVAVMAIVLILAFGMYCVVAHKGQDIK